MKTIITLALIILLFACSEKDGKRISLPIEYHFGYGPFTPSWAILTNQRTGNPNDDKWHKIYLPIMNIPKGWSHVKKEMVWLDSYQLIYQNYKRGTITEKTYKDLQQSWQWKPDEAKLSAKAIKCYVYVIWGVDAGGNWAAMIDTNNDLDFGNEEAFWPDVVDDRTLDNYKKLGRTFEVQFETFREGRVVSTKIPMVVKQLGADFVYNFPRYASSRIRVDGKEGSILIVSDNFSGPSFEKTTIAYQPDTIKESIYSEKDLVQMRQVMDVGGFMSIRKFKNLGVDRFSEKLILETTNSELAQSQNVIQAGYLLQPFQGKEFSSGKQISLNSMKGKFVFIDFWGKGCIGCVANLPGFNKIYDTLDRSKVEFVGITMDGDLHLEKSIKKYTIRWPQIQSDSVNRLFEKYQIVGLPVSLLLDRQGRILDINLRPDDLKVKLTTLLSQK